MTDFDFINFSANVQIAGALFLIASILMIILFKITSEKKPRHKSLK